MGDTQGWAGTVEAQQALLKNHANTSVKRLKAAGGQVLRAPGRPGGHGGLGKACVNLALVLT